MIDGPNEYTYVRQNPWTLFDPEGLAPITNDIRAKIAKDLQNAADRTELYYRGTKASGLTRQAYFEKLVGQTQYIGYIVFEQSINPDGKAIGLQKYPTRFAKESVRPDVMVLKDSDYKTPVTNGGGYDLKGKIDNVIDLKTGGAEMKEDWKEKVVGRLGLSPDNIQTIKDGKTLSLPESSSLEDYNAGKALRALQGEVEEGGGRLPRTGEGFNNIYGFWNIYDMLKEAAADMNPYYNEDQVESQAWAIRAYPPDRPDGSYSPEQKARAQQEYEDHFNEIYDEDMQGHGHVI